LQTIEISGVYTLPVTDKSIEFIAIVDDGYDYTEITEQNNLIRIGYVATAIDDPLRQEKVLNVFPMPFADDVNFEYLLDKEYRSVTLKVFDLSGKLWMELGNCPSEDGINSLQWRNTGMPQGNYVYRMTGQDASGSETLLFTGRLTKVSQ
jgi:hypothetical protein